MTEMRCKQCHGKYDPRHSLAKEPDLFCGKTCESGVADPRTLRMKSNEARRDWADVLQHVRQGGTVIVEHYNRAIADVRPHADSLESIADDTGATREAVLAALDDLITRYGTEAVVVSEEDGTVTANAGVVLRAQLGKLPA